ncbi:hypothetical protein ACTXG7_07415 [Mycolicibacterium sp. Dal123E01]
MAILPIVTALAPRASMTSAHQPDDARTDGGYLRVATLSVAAP